MPCVRNESTAANWPRRLSYVMKRFSLTGRIIAIVIGCQLSLTAGLTIAAVLYGRTKLSNSFDEALQGRAMSTLALVRYTETHAPDLMFDPTLLPPSSGVRHRDLFTIRKADGRLLAQSKTGLPQGLAASVGSYVDLKVAGTPYRAIVLRNVKVLDEEEDESGPPARVTVVYASSLAGMRERLAELGISVAATSLFLLLVASGVAAWGVRRGLEPLRELAQQASAISVHNWNFSPPPAARTTRELARLTTAIERVLARLQDSFRQQRDFTSNAAHELKTSVAILKSTLQFLLHRPRREEEYRKGLMDLLEDCGRLEQLVDRMLRLARIEQRAESGFPRQLAITELTSTCEAAVSRMQRWATARKITLELVNHDGAGIHLRADPEDLELVWTNLIENALHYSPIGSEVVLRIQPDGGQTASVAVEDRGPGIPTEEIPYVFERFHRGDRSRARSTGGFGLGLAICKALVVACGGQIEVANRPEGGTRVVVHLPVVPD
jgi:signal transduction histidine kinase